MLIQMLVARVLEPHFACWLRQRVLAQLWRMFCERNVWVPTCSQRLMPAGREGLSPAHGVCCWVA